MKHFLIVCLASAACSAEPITNSIGMRLVPIEPGTFIMGQDGPAPDNKMTKHPEKFENAHWDEKPAHRVEITQPFYMSATEVTVGQDRQSDPDFRKDTPDDEAVNSISWKQAVMCCDWLSKKQGKTNSEIATILGVTIHAVNRHLEHILSKLGIESRQKTIIIVQDKAPRQR